MTTGALIRALACEGVLTAGTDPGRRKQVERALASDAAHELGIRRVEGLYPPVGGRRGRPARVAWAMGRTGGDELLGESKVRRILECLKRTARRCH